MKTAIIGAALCIALTSTAIAETGGYPASPSHGIIGTNPDGTPRYGGEPGRDTTSANTVGRGNSNPSDNHSSAGAAHGADKHQERK
jgi:hypothetical protein